MVEYLLDSLSSLIAISIIRQGLCEFAIIEETEFDLHIDSLIFRLLTLAQNRQAHSLQYYLNHLHNTPITIFRIISKIRHLYSLSTSQFFTQNLKLAREKEIIVVSGEF